MSYRRNKEMVAGAENMHVRGGHEISGQRVKI